MDKKRETVIFVVVIVILIVLAIISLPARSNSENAFDDMFGKSKKGELGSYIEEMRDTQTKSQRDNTIKLYISTLAQGHSNRGKVLTPAEAPEICELAKSIATGTSLEKAEQISNYLNTEIEYDWGNIVIDTTGKPRTRTKKNPAEVIETKTAICGELANTYMLMSRCVGVNTYQVYGGGHAWNVVEISGQYYEVDTTQGCFNCDVSKPEHSYPIVGLCDFDRCITITKITSIIDQTLGK